MIARRSSSPQTTSVPNSPFESHIVFAICKHFPFVVMTNQHLEDVYQKYWSAFETFRRFPHIKTMDDNEKFCNLLRGLLDDHLTIIPSLTIGIVESSHHLQPQQLINLWSAC